MLKQKNKSSTLLFACEKYWQIDNINILLKKNMRRLHTHLFKKSKGKHNYGKVISFFEEVLIKFIASSKMKRNKKNRNVITVNL